MKYAISCVMLLAFFAQEFEAVAYSGKAQGFEFVTNDGALFSRAFLDNDHLLLDFPVQQRGYLFKQDSYVYLNRSEKTYRVHSYAFLISNPPYKPNVDASPNTSPDLAAAGFEWTGDTEEIAGLRAKKLVRMSEGKVQTEIWVSRETTPMMLQTVARQMRANLPMNYWNEDTPAPTLLQVLLVFGLPLRIVNHGDVGSELTAVAMDADNIPDDWFSVPSNYHQREP